VVSVVVLPAMVAVCHLVAVLVLVFQQADLVDSAVVSELLHQWVLVSVV